MGIPRDRILIVENDPKICDLIGRQALQPLGYQVQTVSDASAAIPQAKQFQPDTLIVDLNLPGLSGKDLLVALSSQGVKVPVVVLAHKETDADIIQAFRLGATDYLTWPARDAEIVAVVERALKQVRERREKEQLAKQLQQANQELQNRVRELTTIFTIGKAVTSITDQRTLVERIIDGALRVTGSDVGWFLLRDDASRAFILVGHRNLPATLAARLNQPWDDGISSLVATSGETLSIYGGPFKRFKISELGYAALIIPVKARRQVIGLICVIRKTNRAFTQSEQSLLEAAADYASISLVNSRLFRALENRVNTLQQASETAKHSEKNKTDRINTAVQELRGQIETTKEYMTLLSQGKKGKLPPEQQQVVLAAREKLSRMSALVSHLANPASAPAREMGIINLNDLARQALAHYHRAAQQNGLTLASNLASPPVLAWGDADQVAQMLDGLLSNAVKFSRPGGQISVHTERLVDNLAHVTVRDTGIGIDGKAIPSLFDASVCKQEPVTQLAGKPAMNLHALRDCVTALGGKTWVESRPGKGSAFHITLLPPQENR